MKSLSVIIPTLNEETNISQLLDLLYKNKSQITKEIIVADGGSTDRTKQIAAEGGATVLECNVKRRSMQMNMGAQQCSGDILWFVHADCFPPSTFEKDILEAVYSGYPVGCYRYKFRTRKRLLRINTFFNRFPFLFCRGGDQTLFITREVFNKLNGFREDFMIMEDYDIISRAKKYYSFYIIPKYCFVSDRKYKLNSFLRVNFANVLVYNMYSIGFRQTILYNTYKRLLKCQS